MNIRLTQYIMHLVHLGRYELLRRLGRGGMAEVFEARLVGAEGFERRVALKRVIPEFASEASFRRMFLDEAKIASRLHHHNITAVLDYGVEDGVPYQVLELVDGSDARTLTRAGVLHGRRVPVAAALHITAEIARGLHHAHEACDEAGRSLGVVHRDVTPGNMLISWSGDVKLSDFGIALAADRTERTSTGVAKGKLAYMPPEQALAAGVDRRSDVFALGCSLHALLTGHSPVDGQEALAGMLRGEPLRVDDARLNPDVAALVRRATMPAPRDRYATAQELATACESLAAFAGGPRALREWLVELRPQVEADRVPTAELKLEWVARPEEPAARADTRAARRMAGAASVDTDAATPATARPASAARRALPTAAAVASLLIVAAVGAVWAWGEGSSRPLSSPDTSGTSSPITAVDAGGRPFPTPVVTPSPTRELADAALPRADGVRADSPPRDPTSPPPRQPERHLRHIAHPAIDTSADSTVRAAPGPGAPAWLSIFGAGAVRARIRVDGQTCCDAVSGAPYGFGPKRIRLPVGSHGVSLETPEGTSLGPYPVVIRETHTEGHPQRLRVDLPVQ